MKKVCLDLFSFVKYARPLCFVLVPFSFSFLLLIQCFFRSLLFYLRKILLENIDCRLVQCWIAYTCVCIVYNCDEALHVLVE